MVLVDALLFLVGLTSLTLGADWLVTGASRVAEHRGVSPLLVGLTVVAFGTSAPELVVSTTAVLAGKSGIAIGNVMGSTVANVGLIVGLGAIVRPINVHRKLLQREAPLMVLVLAAVMVFAANGVIGLLDGLILVGGFTLYMLYLVRWGKSESETGQFQAARIEARAGDSGLVRRPYLNWLRVAFGTALLLVGASWMIDSAVKIAIAYQVPEEVVGATMVAVGTSLPELASTIAAAARGLGDIAIGNVIGSNIFNLGLVLGSAALLSPLHLAPATVATQVVPAMIFCLVLIPLAYTGERVNRFEGALLLAGYAAFLYQVL
ncbi:MAG: calcium/sodium antiporter [marine benthic group bacterium]|nr:calcium/sodium antiporter [Candidatus Benthicola marisminoris]